MYLVHVKSEETLPAEKCYLTKNYIIFEEGIKKIFRIIRYVCFNVDALFFVINH